MTEIRHETVTARGLRFHVARAGAGRPLLLLHGWPEFWLSWEPVMQRLAGRFDLIAPDLRGFGATDKPDAGPSDKAGPEVHAADMLALLEVLGLPKAGVVAHDVGAYVGQVMGREAPGRCAGLFFFDCPYPGIGPRGAAPDHLKEIWYQFFHQKDFAAALVGSSREACRLYFQHFLRHWSAGNPAAFDDVLEAWVDNFMAPGNLQGGFNWYISQNAARLAMLRGEAPLPAPVTVKTCVRWGALDPVLKAEWSDRLPEFFTDLDATVLPGLGHFPHREDPDRAAAEIAAFFDRIW
ncbi:alpha/beta hydrolase [Siccirubricoccus sp. KC 17139]|uniref:Alpha/beta hydrolase n=1 Tax=Siccirubricoccus soli TaxID=2899147 RepID=A0ABT1DC10_9PROT|nr:alpha/beta hydrolase [Siccirubricoccus soli]MCO6419478.1 alpha/beta hydrolase [Siccirubricoccus soli]MCP2685613.1 alpha/beta hydrolase [Siccirubricoccus soli]